MIKEMIVHGESKPNQMQRIGMYFSRRMDMSSFGRESFPSDGREVPYKLARFIDFAKENLFILSDFLDPDLFAHRAVLTALGDASMRKVDIRIVVGSDYDRASTDIIDGSLGGVLINVLKDGPVEYPFITGDGKYIWIVSPEANYILCKMDRRFTRQMEAKFRQIYNLTQPLLLEPTKVSV
ncbi:MAG: hypothetical protein Q8R11_00335 [bacterium]|nr:hypothetical protein [bacterium]